MNLDGSYPDGLYDSERIKAELQGQERPEDLVKSPVYLNQALNEFITMQRDGAWGNDTYREAGNTAIMDPENGSEIAPNYETAQAETDFGKTS